MKVQVTPVKKKWKKVDYESRVNDKQAMIDTIALAKEWKADHLGDVVDSELWRSLFAEEMATIDKVGIDAYLSYIIDDD